MSDDVKAIQRPVLEIHPIGTGLAVFLVVAGESRDDRYYVPLGASDDREDAKRRAVLFLEHAAAAVRAL